MNFDKDHYATLGCTPNAEQSVIQAAYRALAKRHHPDANKGSDESKIKFQEIQEAYEVLNDPTKRAYYDSMRAGTSGREYVPGEQQTEETISDFVVEDEKWLIIIKYFPKIDKLAEELYQISPNLKKIFQIILISNKNFVDSKIIAGHIEEIYLETYFGKNVKVKDLAKKLLRHKDKYQSSAALEELNKTILILGEEAPHDAIIHNMITKYDLWWTIYKNKEPFNSDELLKSIEWQSRLPQTPEVWLAIAGCCKNYGWAAGLYNGEYKLPRNGFLFIKIDSQEHKYFNNTDDARAAMGISIYDIIASRRNIHFKNVMENDPTFRQR